ncbi:hypothetical protein D3C86_1311130 [compost metagenome]
MKRTTFLVGSAVLNPDPIRVTDVPTRPERMLMLSRAKTVPVLRYSPVWRLKAR